MRRTWQTLVAMAVLVAAAVALVVLPTAMTQPMRYHTPELIGRLHAVERWATPVTAAFTLVAALLAMRLWRRDSRALVRGAAIVAVAALAAATWLSRAYLVELLMFAPVPELEFVAVEAASHVAPDDLVLGVVTDGAARAYPVRMAAYHHIFNDRLGEVPFVVTY